MCNIALKKEKSATFVTIHTYGMSQMIIVLLKSNILHGCHLEIQNGHQFNTFCNIFASTLYINTILVLKGEFMRLSSSIISFYRKSVMEFFYGGHLEIQNGRPT
jgi:hypothetical protein